MTGELSNITMQANKAVLEILESANCKPNDIFVMGCSSSEVGGEKIGTHSSVELAKAVFDGIYPELKKRGIFLAAQCCEHLNRALVIEREAAELYGYPVVNVRPVPKAGGSFATTAYETFSSPVAVEAIQASAGLDIGGTLIGMHLKPVAVPIRISFDHIGEAHITCARTRPKFIGGARAQYVEDLL